MLKDSIFIFLTLSICLHFMLYSGLSASKQDTANTQDISIEIIDKSAKNLKKQQIVEQQKRVNDELPDESAFLSQFNQTVKEQTQAKRVGKFINTAGHSNEPQKEADFRPKKVKPKKMSPNGLPTLDDLRLKTNYQQQRPSGMASQNDDHIDKVKEGVQTLLSTREFLYYSYYTRIKNKLRRHWGNKVREKVSFLMKKGRSIASTRDRITKVIIVLNDSGVLVRVQVVGQSGVIDLDEAAVEAFREAAPFPNPPRGMIETDGNVRIFWDFVLEA